MALRTTSTVIGWASLRLMQRHIDDEMAGVGHGRGSPGWISVVEFGSSITAGPSTRAPAASDGRHTMRVRTGFAGIVEDHVARLVGDGGSGVHGSDSQRSASVSVRGAVTTRRMLTISIDSSGAAWP